MDEDTFHTDFYDEWIDDTHWIHFHHSDDPRHWSDGFGDSPHHTGFLLTALILLDDTGHPPYSEEFIDGLYERLREDYVLIRHPRTKSDDDRRVVVNRDQMTPLLFVINYFDSTLARKIYEANKDNLVLLPLHRNFFDRCIEKKNNYLWRLFCDFLEIWDTIFDIWNLNVGRSRKFRNVYVINGPSQYGINSTDSSIIKSYLRSVISRLRYPTFLARTNAWLLRKTINIPASFSRYFTFRFNWGVDTPPPIHLVWEDIYEKYS
jgi:hypothetical protein